MEYRNAKYTSLGYIDCEINHPDYGWIPFLCDPDDKGAQFDTFELFERMKIDALPYDGNYEEEAMIIRINRDNLLKETDWTQLYDVPESTKLNWATYRQALRDIPQQPGFPTDVIWPTKPENV